MLNNIALQMLQKLPNYKLINEFVISINEQVLKN